MTIHRFGSQEEAVAALEVFCRRVAQVADECQISAVVMSVAAGVENKSVASGRVYLKIQPFTIGVQARSRVMRLMVSHLVDACDEDGVTSESEVPS